MYMNLLSYEALWEQVKCEFNLYPSHDEDEIIIHDKPVYMNRG